MNQILIDLLAKARLEIFVDNPFLGFVLQHFEIILDEKVKTAATNSEVIYFAPEFLYSLNM